MQNCKLTITVCMTAFYIGCKLPPPVIDPPPPPPPVKRVVITDKEDFSAAPKLWASAKTYQNASGRIVLSSPVAHSAWVYSTKTFYLDSLISVTAKIEPNADFAFGFAPAQGLDLNAVNGFFGTSTRARFYIWGAPGRLYRHFKVGGFLSENYLSQAITVKTPAWLRFSFTKRKVKYEYSENGTDFTVVGADTLLPAFSNEVRFELAAYDTPSKGIAYLDEATAIYYGRKPDTVSVMWNQNTEPDLAHYVVEQTERGQVTRYTTKATFQRVVVTDSASFRVFAVDMANNVSAPSATVKHKNRNVQWQKRLSR